MNLIIMAEGVETVEISDLLLNLGITHQQGYYFSRPRTSGDLVASGKRVFQPTARSNSTQEQPGPSGSSPPHLG